MVSSRNRFSYIQTHWAKIFIDGLVVGYPDNLSKPENIITRAKALVALASGILGANPALTTNLILSNIY